ncbi:MAG: prepilin-type N-terminal cleavage/methylation domain-containing protein [Methylococcales bacterium]|nr:prepilin-type N-terminal cleavage/methylation domain-containing protein [Methylococcales bacterium]
MKVINQKGFTLIELMIVIAIIGILASIALPAYQTYMKKAKFSEIVLSTTDMKTAVNLCFQSQLNLTSCETDGSNGIKNITTSAGDVTAGAKVKTVAIATGGVILATATGTAGTAVNGLEGETYTLTPTKSTAGDKLIWSSVCSDPSLC